MTDRSSIYQVVQVGKETTPGIGVAASKRLLATSIEFGPKPEIKMFRPSGFKYDTISAMQKEYVEGSIKGQLTYTDLVYLLSSLITTVTPSTTGTTGKTWSFSSDTDGPDTPATFTVEQGSSVRAHKFNYGLVTGLGLKFNGDSTDIDGSIIGLALQDGVTMTATPTDIPLQPVTRPQILVYLADTAAGLSAASALGRAISASWSLTDRFKPVWVLNGETDYGAHVEDVAKSEIKLMLEADAEGMGLLTTMRANATKFIRIQATGPVIGAGPATYELTLDSAFKISDVAPFKDEDGIFAIEWTGSIVHDATWGKAFQIDVTNALASL
jgi:hypothetical protein